MTRKLQHFAAAFGAAMTAASLAGGQPVVQLDRYEPAPPGDALPAVADPTAAGRCRLSAGLRLSYAHDPLELVERTDGLSHTTKLVGHQLVGHALVAACLGQRLLVDLDAPFALSQGGDGATGYARPGSTDLGDLRLGARVALLEQQEHLPAAALGAQAWLPTGSGPYTSSEDVRFGASVLLGADYAEWLWRAAIGARQRSGASAYDGVFGSEAVLAVGGGIHVGSALLGVELLSATAIESRWLRKQGTHLEALLSGRYSMGPLSVFVAGGPGLTRGAGTPEFRLLAGADVRAEFCKHAEPEAGEAAQGAAAPVTTTPSTAPASAATAATTAPADTVADRDHDQVPDRTDRCPDVVGVPGGTRPGCPPDADGDGIPDADDHCPAVPGAANPDPARHGCPPDRDADSVPDGADACPDEKGFATGDPKTNGCPPSVRVVGSQIVITEQVTFATASDVLTAESSGVLEQVAAVLREHPELARLAIDGHTDDAGTDQTNLALSRRRALSVVRWLVEHGIDERRLEARGFGARRPIADRKSPEGRAKNRRVEFQIIKRSDLGEGGWQDGPADE